MQAHLQREQPGGPDADKRESAIAKDILISVGVDTGGPIRVQIDLIVGAKVDGEKSRRDIQPLMYDRVAGTVAGNIGRSIIRVRSRVTGQIFQSRGEIQSSAEAVRCANRQGLYAKEYVVTRRSPSQDKVAVRGLK